MQYIHGIADEERAKMKDLTFDDDSEGAAANADTGLGLSALGDSLFQSYVPDEEGIKQNRLFSEEFLKSCETGPEAAPSKGGSGDGDDEEEDDNEEEGDDDDEQEEEEEEEEEEEKGDQLRKRNMSHKKRSGGRDNEVDNCDDSDGSNCQDVGIHHVNDGLVYLGEGGEDTCIDPQVEDCLKEIEENVETLLTRKRKVIALKEIIPLLENFWTEKNIVSSGMVRRWESAIKSAREGICNFCSCI
jgi:hypothetical protein